MRLNENDDYKGFYEPVARNVIAGHGFTSTDGTPALRYPPGYPLLLASLFRLSDFLHISEETILSTFILISMGSSSVFVFLLARSVWGARSALVSSLVWMTYPVTLWLTKQPNSEIPFLVVFYGGFCLFWHALLGKRRAWPVFFLVGLLAGFAMLIRPIAVGIGLLMGATLWVVDREVTVRFRAFLVMMVLLGNLVAILPWQTWVYSVTGKVVVLSWGGVPSIRDGLTFGVAQTSTGYRQTVNVPQDVTTLMQDILVHSNEMRSLGGVVAVMTDKLRTQPLTVVQLFGVKAARSWYGTDSGRFELQIMLIQAPYLVLILWGGVCAWRQGGIAKQLTICVCLMLLYFWGMTVFALSILRYMAPMIGLSFILLPAAFFRQSSYESNT
jgi:Dolichyl-phosphate-mannose-protein mannosyltransferase